MGDPKPGKVSQALFRTDQGDGPARKVIIGSMVAGLVLSGVAFAYKVAEFMFTLTAGEFAGTFDIQVMVYFSIAAGWLLLLIWCFWAGKFKEMEAEKADILALEEEYDRLGI